jgi:hypothetical protein
LDARRTDEGPRTQAAPATRRTVLKGVGGLAAAAAGMLGLAGAAAARNRPRNDDVDRSCLDRCRDHDRNRCHQRCRRRD